MNPQNKIHFTGLNGIRAIAAMAVIISHISLSLGEFGLDSHILGSFQDGIPRALELSGLGVSIFFTLSGFLITFLLLREKQKQSINVGNFYMRRILRIWPLYYAYFLVALIVIYFIGHEVQPSSLFFYIFYGANIPSIIGGVLPFVAHYWSLGVEEQFYMIWPWLIKKTKNNLLPIIITIAVILFGTKIFLHVLYPGTILELAIHVTRFHCMLVGAAAAILYYNNNKFFLQVFSSIASQLIAWGAILLAAVNHLHISSVLQNEFISFVAVALIMGQITRKNRIINLDTRLFDFLGKISYGLYVIHPLVIFFYSSVFGTLAFWPIVNYFIVYSTITLTTIFIAYLSYEYFEKRFLKLKDKYSVIKSSGSKHYKRDFIPRISKAA